MCNGRDWLAVGGGTTELLFADHSIQALNAKAVDTLDALLDVADAPSVRLGAAKTIVDIGIHQHDANTIMRKLDEIEQWQQRQELMKPNLSPF